MYAIRSYYALLVSLTTTVGFSVGLYLGDWTGFDLQRNTTDERAYLAADGSLQSNYATEEDINALYGEMKLDVVRA